MSMSHPVVAVCLELLGGSMLVRERRVQLLNFCAYCFSRIRLWLQFSLCLYMYSGIYVVVVIIKLFLTVLKLLDL